MDFLWLLRIGQLNATPFVQKNIAMITSMMTQRMLGLDATNAMIATSVIMANKSALSILKTGSLIPAYIAITMTQNASITSTGGKEMGSVWMAARLIY